MIHESDILAALDKVIQPTFGMSLVSLQMIRSVEINEGGIQLQMVMNCPGCAAGRVALAQAHRALRYLLTAKDQEVTIVLLPEIWHAPWEFGG